MKRGQLASITIQAIALLVALVPIFPGVFFRGETLVPMSHMYEQSPWSAHRPADFPEQNPLGSEVTVSVCVWYVLTDAAFDRGELPLWNPLQFMGAPLIGNFQTAIFYPPRLLFRLIHDTYIAMTVYIVFRFWLCGFVAFIAARLLGLRPPFANLYSFIYMLAGYNVIWAYYPPPDVMAWLPLLFAATEVLLRRRYRLGFSLLIIGLTLSILAAHPSSILFGSIGLGIYAAIRLLIARGPMRHALVCIGCGAAAFAFALALSAVQLLPFIEYMPEMALYIARFFPEGVAHYTYAVYDLLGIWGGRIMGTEAEGTFWGTTNHTYAGMLYIGIVPWVCLALLAARLKLGGFERARIRSLLAVSALCAYFATNFPWASLVQGLPILNGSRPAYFIAFPTMAIPFCGAFALQAWAEEQSGARSLRRPAGAAVIVLLLVAGAILSAPYIAFDYMESLNKNPHLGNYVMTQLAISIAFAAGAFLLLAVWARAKARAWPLVWVLCALAVADQAVAMHGLIATTSRQYVVPQTKVTDFLRTQEPPCRVRFDTAGIKPGYPSLYGIEEFGGYDAVYPKRMEAFFDRLPLAPGTAGDALLSCDYGLFPRGAPLPEGYDAVQTMEGVTIATNTGKIPRARLVDTVEQFDSTESMFKEMRKPAFDPRSAVYTAAPIDFKLPPSDGSSAGSAAITEWESQHVTVQADAGKECVLVLADGYYPGWKATVDGVPAKIFPAYYLYRGVHLTPGKHTIVFRYEPESIRIGFFISFIALTVSSILALLFLLGRPRRAGKSAQANAALE